MRQSVSSCLLYTSPQLLHCSAGGSLCPASCTTKTRKKQSWVSRVTSHFEGVRLKMRKTHNHVLDLPVFATWCSGGRTDRRRAFLGAFRRAGRTVRSLTSQKTRRHLTRQSYKIKAALSQPDPRKEKSPNSIFAIRRKGPSTNVGLSQSTTCVCCSSLRRCPILVRSAVLTIQVSF